MIERDLFVGEGPVVPPPVQHRVAVAESKRSALVVEASRPAPPDIVRRVVVAFGAHHKSGPVFSEHKYIGRVLSHLQLAKLVVKPKGSQIARLVGAGRAVEGS